jgi:hypothetical protein
MKMTEGRKKKAPGIESGDCLELMLARKPGVAGADKKSGWVSLTIDSSVGCTWVRICPNWGGAHELGCKILTAMEGLIVMVFNVLFLGVGGT